MVYALVPEARDALVPRLVETSLAIDGADTVAAFREGSAEPDANRTAILEFIVEDVDAVFAR